ncbi:hypothetical protein Ancab_014393 [Ancistrocladus abbreviatus]
MEVCSQLSKITALKTFDGKNGSWVNGYQIARHLLKFRCLANLQSINPNNSKDLFLNLHPKISLLRRNDEGTTMSGPRSDVSSESITESLRDSSYSNYNEAKIKVIRVGSGRSNAVNRMMENSMKGVEFWIVNTDIQAMRISPVFPENRLQIDLELT